MNGLILLVLLLQLGVVLNRKVYDPCVDICTVPGVSCYVIFTGYQVCQYHIPGFYHPEDLSYGRGRRRHIGKGVLHSAKCFQIERLIIDRQVPGDLGSVQAVELMIGQYENLSDRQS